MEATMTRYLTAATALLIASTVAANACAPAPRCWLGENKDYLRTMCRQEMKAGATVERLVYEAEPEYADETKAQAMRDGRAFIAACQKLGISFPQR
jgi:hypothetical protein